MPEQFIMGCSGDRAQGLNSWKMITKKLKIFCLCLALALMAYGLGAQSPNWSLPQGVSFEYSANVIAALSYNELPANDPANQVGFFKDGEVRGLGTPIAMGNGVYLYFVTLYAHQAIDTFNIRVYHQETGEIYEVLHPFIFQSQAITGTFESPFEVAVFPENNAPIYLLPIPSMETLEGWPFTVINLNDYLIQPDGYPVEWTYVNNPNLLVSLADSLLTITGATGFQGTTQLTVRATEITPIAQTRDRGERTAPTTEYFAETTINLTVNPLYAAPLWDPAIPHQGIVAGDTFQLAALDQYENQFTGDSIAYDYLPIMTEAIPAETTPTWQTSGMFPTNMSMICRPMFTPKHHFEHADDLLAAFIGNELRGVCQRNATDHLFYLSIGGQIDEHKKITLKLYSGEMKKTWVMDSVFYFEPYAILGNPGDPHDCDFAPVIPVISDTMAVNGIAHVRFEIADTNYTGNLSFTFIAKDPAYPLYLNDSTEVNLCIVADSSALTTWYEDGDGDGLGNPLNAMYTCLQPEGYVDNNDDCNDEDPGNAGLEIQLTENSGVADDGMICTGSEVSLMASLTAPNYLWSNGATTQTITVNPLSNSSYTVTVSFPGGCSASKTASVEVEGTVVKDSTDAGPGTLRNVLGCALEGTIVTYDYVNVQNTILTTPLLIDKDVIIAGTPLEKPSIKISNSAGFVFIQILAGKTMGLDNVDVLAPGSSGNAIFFGAGKIEILTSTAFGHY